MQTACGIAEALGGGFKIRIEPGLGEMMHHDWFDFPSRGSYPAQTGCPVDASMSTRALVEAFGADRIDESYQPLYDVAGRGASTSKSSELYTFPEEWHEGVARYQSTLRKLQALSPYSVLVTHGAGVQSCAESVEGIDMEDMEINYCCLTNLRRQGAYEWRVDTLASHKHTDALE